VIILHGHFPVYIESDSSFSTGKIILISHSLTLYYNFCLLACYEFGDLPNLKILRFHNYPDYGNDHVEVKINFSSLPQLIKIFLSCCVFKTDANVIFDCANLRSVTLEKIKSSRDRNNTLIPFTQTIIFKTPNLRIISLVCCERIECIFLNRMDLGKQLKREGNICLKVVTFNRIWRFIFNWLHDNFGESCILFLLYPFIYLFVKCLH
jgi:hypothetical protein